MGLPFAKALHKRFTNGSPPSAPSLRTLTTLAGTASVPGRPPANVLPVTGVVISDDVGGSGGDARIFGGDVVSSGAAAPTVGSVDLEVKLPEGSVLVAETTSTDLAAPGEQARRT